MNFSHNPILTTVSGISFGATDTNRVVILTAHVGGHDYTFKHIVTSESSITFDVSSAYRAELLRSGYPTPSSPSSSSVSGSYTAVLQCVRDGKVETLQRALTASPSAHTARLGHYTDAQLLSGSIPDAPSVLTTKPDGEIVATGDTIALGPEQHTVTAGPNTFGFGKRNAYGDDALRTHQFRFVNQYGELESASVLSLETVKVDIKTDTIGQAHSIGSVGRARQRTIHSGGTDTLALSTGYLSREWLSWFAHDFLMSDHHWLRNSAGQWIPVIVTPDSQSTIYDRHTGELKALSFTAQAAVQGQAL